MIVTKESLIHLLDSSPLPKRIQVVGRALVVIYNNQTSGEQANNLTAEQNGVGFTGADAYSGSLTAKYFLKHKTLMPWQLDMWTARNASGVPRIAKYWKQLNRAAEANAALKQQPLNY